MKIRKLAHFSIRTADLAASARFYTDILGFVAGFRPAFDFPGVWLYQDGEERDYGIVHLVGLDPAAPAGLADYLGDKGTDSLRGGGAIDHIAFVADDLPAALQRLQSGGVSFRHRAVPTLGLDQLFFEDPNGITIELNFPQAAATTGHVS